MEQPAVKILLVDDNEIDSRITNHLLKKIPGKSFEIHRVTSFTAGLEALISNAHDVCLLDYRLGAESGLDLLRAAVSRGCKAPIIMLTGQDDQETDLEAMKAGAADYLVKGKMDAALLERSVRYSLERKRQEEILRESQRLERVAKEELEETLKALDSELEMAKKVQESMLPRDLAGINGVYIAAGYFPCGRVGGDLYDVIPVDENRTCFLMLDVVGHGVPAALISAMAKVSFTKNITRTVGPAEIMERVNKEIVNYFEEKRHITAFLAIYDRSAKELSYTKGGHPAPILIRSHGKDLERLANNGLPLGMFPDIKYEVTTTPFEPGDTLVLYTDGLTECCNLADKAFGKKRLEEVLCNVPKESSVDDLLGALIKAQFVFAQGAPKTDDITILIAKIA
jgi:serine phosphatase RsbU (regulator of sigma subunit)